MGTNITVAGNEIPITIDCLSKEQALYEIIQVHGMCFPLSIQLTCGCETTYSNENKFPSKSHKCKHDNYFVFYDWKNINWKERLK